jgi:hypothetical protein
MSACEVWEWENMLWGGAIRWRLECGHDSLLVKRTGDDNSSARPLIIKRVEWAPGHYQPWPLSARLPRSDPYA